MAIKQFQWKDLAGECAGRCTWVAALVVMAVVAGLGVFAVQANALRLAGLMVILAGVVHFIVSLRMASAEAVRRGWVGSIVTLLMGVVVLGAPSLSRTGLIVAIAIWFAIDAVRNLVGFLRQREMSRLLGVLGNAAVAALLIVFRDAAGGIAIVAVSVARILGTAFEILSEKTLAAGDAKDTVVADLNLGDPPQLEFLKEQVAAAEPVARSVDGAWLVTLVLMLFGIHLSRMGFDRSSLGILSPLIAVVGDLVFALLLSFLVIVPVRIAWMRGTRFLELRVWKRGLGLGPATLEAETKVPEANAPETRGTVNRLLMGWVGGRLRF
ncbi:MAG: hypothetical protein GY798_33065, partial [Hyphomicrobiales bacterium]|nr:hypothetical protein [Hyphomicrobiales bacterium]